MSIAKVRSAITKGFVDAGFFTAARTQIENIAFVPPQDDPWCSLWYVPNQPSVATLGATGQDEVDGFLQVDLNYALNSGTEAIEAKAEAIRNVFTAGARFPYQGVEAVIRSCGRSQGRIVNNYFRIVVTIAFYAHINR